MAIIFGTGWAGRVDEEAGECAETLFFHLFYVPLIPLRSMWVTGREVVGERQVRAWSLGIASALVIEDHGDARSGLPIRLDVKSVAAAYLRTWGVALAFACFAVAPSVATGCVAAAVAALSVWSWWWRTPRDADTRRSQLRLLAFGCRCHPRRFRPAARARLRASLEARWRGPGRRPPSDVARFGATTLDEAVVAYGLLILDGQDPLADEIALGHRDRPQDADPFRTGAEPLEPGALEAEISAAARSIVRSDLPPQLWDRPYVRPFVVGTLFAVAAVGFGATVGAWCSAPAIQRVQLEYDPPVGDDIAVACDRITETQDLPPISAERRVAFCVLGSRRMVMVTSHEIPTSATPVQGTLRLHVDSEWFWWSDLTTDPDTLSVYLDIHPRDSERAWALAFAGLGLFAVGLGVFWKITGGRQRSSMR